MFRLTLVGLTIAILLVCGALAPQQATTASETTAVSISTPVPATWKVFFPSALRASFRPPAEIASIVLGMCHQACSNIVLSGVRDGSGNQDIRGVRVDSAGCLASFDVRADFQYSVHLHSAAGDSLVSGQGPVSLNGFCEGTFFYAGSIG